MSALLPWMAAAIPLFALAVTLLNLFTWPRGRRGARAREAVSVLIPARNEAEHIEAAVRAVLASAHPIAEVLVYDDASTDQTPEILAALAAEDPRLRVLRGAGLPPGWVGKAHACQRLAEAAQGELLVFVDADTRLDPSGLERLAELFATLGADVVTAVPRQEMVGFAERAVLPLLHLTYTSWLPLPLVWLSRDPRLLAANGQVLALRRAVFAAIGGFAAVRADVVEDMALCRLAKTRGARVIFADGHHIACCRMYRSAREVWEGFSKNIYPGLGGRPAALLGVLGLYGGGFVAPYALLFFGLTGAPGLLAPGAAGVLACVLLRAALALRFRHPPEGVLLHPLAVLALLGIALNSWRWYRRGAIRWRGRTYAPGARPSAGGLS